MKIFETHTHLDDRLFDNDRSEVIERCYDQGVKKMINISCDALSMQNSIKLAEKYDFIYAAAGFHPHDAKVLDLNLVRKAAQHPKVVAIGEIGLDYYRNLSPKNTQIDAFCKQLELAKELKLPVIIHDRDAHEDIMNILLEYTPDKVVFHCFAGNVSMAEKIIEKGWFISFTGNITYKKSHLPDIVRYVPDHQYFVETDSPYLSPHPRRGKRNDPSNLRYILEKIADIKHQPPKQIAKHTWENASGFFKLQ